MKKRAAVGYVRVSDPKQVEGTSLETQRERIEKYAQDHDWNLIQIYADEATAYNDLLALGAIQACHELGRRS